MRIQIYKHGLHQVYTHDRGRGKPHGTIHHEIRQGRDWSEFHKPGGIMGHTIAIKYPGHTETTNYKSHYIPSQIIVYRVNSEVNEGIVRNLCVTEIMSMPVKTKASP